MVDLTLLTLTPLSGDYGPLLTPYSVRALTQTLEPIPGGQNWLRRDVNGVLVDGAPRKFRKYSVVITCTDQMAPALDGVWKGMPVEVGSAVELNFLTGAGSPARPVVSGSLREEGSFTFYRPLLTMRVSDYSNSLAEWPAEYAWKLMLLEI